MRKSDIRSRNAEPGRRSFLGSLFAGLVAAPSAAQLARSTSGTGMLALDPEPFLTEIRLFSGTFAPVGWEFANGQLLTLSQNTALFSLLGTTFGGNGETNFALPDLRRRFPRGAKYSESPVGQTGGAETVTLSANELPSHNHSLKVNSVSGTAHNPSGKAFATNSEGIAQYASSPSAALNNGMILSAGGGGSHNNMPPYLGLNYIICVDGLFPSDDTSQGMDGRYISEIMLIATDFAPADWAACEGQLLPIAEYETLFTLLGTTFGGDGQETFGLPDLRNRTPIGQKSGEYVVGQTGGNAEVTLNSTHIPTHSHDVAAHTGVATASSPTGNVPAANLEGVRQFASGTDTTMAASTVGNAGGGQPHNNLPPYCSLTYCIALAGVFPSPT